MLFWDFFQKQEKITDYSGVFLSTLFGENDAMMGFFCLTTCEAEDDCCRYLCFILF